MRRALRIACGAVLLLVVTVATSGTSAASFAGRTDASLTPHLTTRAAAVSAMSDSSTVRPLLIVLDTSGSMSDDDGTGTIKLAGAQAALTSVLRHQRPGAEVGLWTFPNDGDCGSGTSAIDVGPLDQDRMIAAVNALTADGGTPTGTALQAAVDSIKGEYPDGATVLLISDGLHTCDPDPCETAKDIRASGFDLTVSTAGFQTSPEGMAELSCIADATGGATYAANDSAQLGQVVTEATNNQLTLKVDGLPSQVPAGAARTVTVTVSNETAQDVADARLSFSFAGAGAKGGQVIPSVLPPRVALGNIAAGTSRTYSWLVGFGSPGQTGTASYLISAWGANSEPTSKDGSITLTSANQTLSDAAGVVGSLKGKRIAILGDSYSSGEGAGNYEAGTLKPPKGNGCHKSRNTYMAPLFQNKNVELIACSGAVAQYGSNGKDINAVVDEQVPTLERQLGKDGPIDAAFMTIGGNDIGFADIIQACVLGHPDVRPTLGLTGVKIKVWNYRCSDDTSWKAGVAAKVNSLTGTLQTAYQGVYDAINSEAQIKKRGSVAPLYVLAYPQPFPGSQYHYSCPAIEGAVFDDREVAFADQLVQDLNARIQSATADLLKDGYRIEMVRDTQDAFLPDNTLCPRPGHASYVNSVVSSAAVTGGDAKQELMHPNTSGYRAETNAIIAWSQVDEVAPAKGKDWRHGRGAGPGLVVTLGDTLSQLATSVVSPQNQASLDLQSRTLTPGDLSLRAGQKLVVTVTGGSPDSDVDLTVRSDATLMGKVHLDKNGRGTATLVVPTDVVQGAHHLQALGFDAHDNPVIAVSDLDVTRAVPPWWLPVTVASLIALLLGLLLLRRGLRARRTASGSG